MSESYSQLTEASERLSELIRASEGRTNADMRKLAEAINSLCDDWQL